jgi:hypothetical protein
MFIDKQGSMMPMCVAQHGNTLHMKKGRTRLSEVDQQHPLPVGTKAKKVKKYENSTECTKHSSLLPSEQPQFVLA